MDYLIHYGVKGMKWGVRKYQNKDGTWTSLGKCRRSKREVYDSDYDSVKDYIPYKNETEYQKAVDKKYKELNKKNYNSKLEQTYDAIEMARHGENEAGKMAEKGTIKKDTKMYRVSYNPDEQIDNNRKYVTLSKYEAKQYADPYQSLTWIQTELGREYGDYETGTVLEYTAVKDLKVANSKQVRDFLNTFSDTKIEDIGIYDQHGKAVQDYSKEYDNIQAIRDAMFTQYSKLNDKNLNGQKVYKYFKEHGYDAISDIEDFGVGSDRAALIILNPKESIKETKRSKVKEVGYDYRWD